MKYLARLIASIVSLAAVALAQPWQPVVIWDREGATDSAHYGYNVFPLGDQNQDGYDDFGIWARGRTNSMGTTDDFPRLEFYHGGNPPSMTPYFLWTSSIVSAWDLQAEDIGDFNGDSNTDWIIRRPDMDNINWYFYNVYYGGSAADTIPDLTFYRYLSPFYTIGDYNGDGFGDLWRWDARTGVDIGELFLGSSAPDTIPDLTLQHYVGERGRANWRQLGDLNGDEQTDGLSRSDNHTLFIYLGNTSPDTNADYVWENYPALPLAIVNDLNNDGFDEIVAEDRALHYGRDSLHQAPDLYLQFNGWFTQVASAGDVNADGFNDFAGTSIYAGPCWGYAGGYLGGSWQNPEPAWLLCGGDNGPYYPRVARGAGDVNGDGVDDMLVSGAGEGDIYVGERGRVLILAGDSTLRVSAEERPEIPRELRITVYPNPFNSSATIELSLPLISSPLELTLYNTLGQVAYHETLRPTSTRVRHSIPTKGLASGVYILSCQAGEMTATQKLFLLR